MYRSKRLAEMEVGDFLTSSSEVYRVTRILKTQLEVVPWKNDEGDMSNARRVTKKTGKVVGSFRANMRGLYEDETPESIDEKALSKQMERKEQREEKERKHQERLAAVLEANTEMKIEEMEMGVKKVIFQNSKGKKGMILFTLIPDSLWDYDKMEEVPAFRITSVVFAYRWDDARAFGSPNDVVSTSTKDGLIELIATTYWN